MSLLTLQNIVFSWNPSSEPVLNFKDFSLSKGEKLLIRGPSGSGKSTILNLIAGLILPQKGSIRILGQEINTLSSSQRDQFRSDHLGFIFQNFNLIPYLDVMESVCLPLRFSENKRRKVSSLGMKEEARILLADLGLEGMESKNVQTLSTGQQQRVAVARALMGSPELIIADEPSSALDADAREAFLNLLFRECERSQSTLLYVSHDAGLEKYFDRHVSMSSFKESSL